MKRILVPIDFSEISLQALKTAVSFIKKQPGSTLTLVHVYEKPLYGISLQFGVDTKEMHKIQEELLAEMHKLGSLDFMKGIDARILLLADTAIWEILGHEKVGPQDLVIMGSYGVKGAKEMFVGSNTQKFLRYSNTPVLIIKDEKKDISFKNLVFCSDFTQDAVKNFLSIKELASLFQAKVHLLKVITPVNFQETSETLQAINEFVRLSNLSNYEIHIYNSISVERGILNFSQDNQIDVITIETHGRTGIAHLINGSVTEDLANRSSLPLLSMRMNNE